MYCFRRQYVGVQSNRLHTHQTVEALLFHGWMIYGAVGCKNRCSFFAGRAQVE